MRRVLLACLLMVVVPSALHAQETAPAVATAATITDEAPFSPGWRWWFGLEYYLWRVKDDRTPGPLVTTGPAGTPGAGVRGNPATGVLYDGSSLDHKFNSGAHPVLGVWLDTDQTLGLEASGFVLETHTLHGKADSNRTDGAPVIARPFVNLLTGQEDVQTVTSPQDPLGGRYLGGIDVFSDSRTWGAELNAVVRPNLGGSLAWVLLGGFRYLGQKDEFRIQQSSTVLTPGTVGYLGTPAPAPDIVSVRDYTETHNNFFGGQVGAHATYTAGRWTVDLLGKVAIGATVQELMMSGHTLLTDSTGLTLYAPGGLYNLPSNLGDFTRTQFTFIAEAGARLGFHLTEHVQAQAGYTFLYWGNVVRPGEQINRLLDPRQIPSNLAYNPAIQATQPGRSFASVDFWAQGLTVGILVGW